MKNERIAKAGGKKEGKKKIERKGKNKESFGCTDVSFSEKGKKE